MGVVRCGLCQGCMCVGCGLAHCMVYSGAVHGCGEVWPVGCAVHGCGEVWSVGVPSMGVAYDVGRAWSMGVVGGWEVSKVCCSQEEVARSCKQPHCTLHSEVGSTDCEQQRPCCIACVEKCGVLSSLHVAGEVRHQ